MMDWRISFRKNSPISVSILGSGTRICGMIEPSRNENNHVQQPSKLFRIPLMSRSKAKTSPSTTTILNVP